jgi:hypothetical protein
VVNLALICQHHHTLIHDHGFHLGREDGELVARTAAGVPLHPRYRTAA